MRVPAVHLDDHGTNTVKLLWIPTAISPGHPGEKNTSRRFGLDVGAPLNQQHRDCPVPRGRCSKEVSYLRPIDFCITQL